MSFFLLCRKKRKKEIEIKFTQNLCELLPVGESPYTTLLTEYTNALRRRRVIGVRAITKNLKNPYQRSPL